MTVSDAMQYAIVIVGGGQAGGRTAEALRLNGHSGRITIVSEEDHLPYERPSLSKAFLLDREKDVIAWVRPPSWYSGAGVEVLRGVRAVEIDRANSAVILERGDRLRYDVLVLAPGARARRLPVKGATEANCIYLRNIEDSLRLRSYLAERKRLAVIGAGFIGLEAAAAAIASGCEVTVLESAPLPLARCLPSDIGAFFAKLHQSNGVHLRTTASVTDIADDGKFLSLKCADGASVETDAILVGIGVAPNIELAQTAGLAVANGIVVNEFGRTNDPAIYSVGDATSHFNPWLGRHIRLESWQNAQNQAIAVAKNILGMNIPYNDVPWFWSDQFDINLQVAGVDFHYPVLIRGSLKEKSALYLYMDGDRVAGAVSVNAGRGMRTARRLIASGESIDTALLSNDSGKKISLN